MNQRPSVLTKIHNQMHAKPLRLTTAYNRRVPSIEELLQLTYLKSAGGKNLQLNTVASLTL